MDINKYSFKEKLSVYSLPSISALGESDIYEVLWLARKLKSRQTMKEPLKDFEGACVVVMLGSKNSGRRVSFEFSVSKLGGKTLYLSPEDSLFGGGLTHVDAMRALGCYGAKGVILKSDKPIGSNTPLPYINLRGEPDAANVLAGLYTLWEKFGRLSGLKIYFLGDGSALDAEEAETYAKCGLSVAVACPEQQKPGPATVCSALAFGDLVVTHDLAAVKNADVITTLGGRQSRYSASEEVMNCAASAVYIHALPVKHGEEVAEGVLYGNRSLVFAQAENLIYVEQALMMLLFGAKRGA